MRPITRTSFLHQCAGLGAILSLPPSLLTTGHRQLLPDDAYKKIVLANTKEVTRLLPTLAVDIIDVKRRLGHDFANLASAYSEPLSDYYRKEEVIPYLLKIIRFLVQSQKEDGTLDLGNLASPPDTAFIIEPLGAAAVILKIENLPAVAEVNALLKTFLLKAGEALRVGGVHTPNHRWVVSAALARINALYPNPSYVKRIDEWLSEGIFVDKDGYYLERSMIYSEVIDRCLITMARFLKRPELLAPVRKNLALTYYCMEPDGALVTNASRRQDQFMTADSLNYYYDYRYLAIHDTNPEFSAITSFIETVQGFDEKIRPDALTSFLEEPLYKKPLPAPKNPSVTFEKFFKEANLVRIRRGYKTTTLFGGTDFPLIISSGRSTSPNFFAFRKGKASLKYLRLSTDFFNTGYFHSQGITQSAGAYVLSQKIVAPYYQPLPANLRRRDGNYAHTQSTDGRFWNKMDFTHRPQSNVQSLAISVQVADKNGANEITINVNGATGVHVTLEFCFKDGGQLTGLKKVDGAADTYFLESNTGEYTYEGDSITFGPGIHTHAKVTGLEGELYSSHFGSLRTSGMHVFCTGLTPFTHSIRIG